MDVLSGGVRLVAVRSIGLPARIAAALALASGAVFGGDATEAIDFNREIRPILSDACYTCHGPDEASREAELRLDLRDAAFADLLTR